MVALIAGNILTLVDQDLETGVGSWGANSNCSIISSPAWAHDGTESLQLTSTAGGAMSAQANGPGFVGYGVNPALLYTVTGWCRAMATPQNCFLYVNWFDSTPTFISNSFYGGAPDSASVDTQIVANNVSPPPTAATAVLGTYVQNTAGANEIHFFDYMGILAPVSSAFGLLVSPRHKIAVPKKRIWIVRAFQPQTVTFAKAPIPIVKHSPVTLLREARFPVYIRNLLTPPTIQRTKPVIVRSRYTFRSNRAIARVMNKPAAVVTFSKSPTPIVVRTRLRVRGNRNITRLHSFVPVVVPTTKSRRPIIVSSTFVQKMVMLRHKPIVISSVPHGGIPPVPLPPVGYLHRHHPRGWPIIGVGE